jgi:hypothetical protein
MIMGQIFMPVLMMRMIRLHIIVKLINFMQIVIHSVELLLVSILY